MFQRDYNRDSYGSNSQPTGYEGNNYQQNLNLMDQQYPPPPPQPGYPNQFYGQPQQQSPFFNRQPGIPGSPVQSTPAVPALSEEDIAIFKETQKNIILKRFLPAAVIGCSAIYMAHQRKVFKPSVWTYGIYLVSTSYITQFTAREELKRRVAESTSMSPFAQQVRMQLGYANKSTDGIFVDESFDTNYSQSYNRQPIGTPTTQYSPYNRFHRQQQTKSSDSFDDEFASGGKDLTEFSSDLRSSQNRSSAEFAPDDVLTGDTGFRTPRVIDQSEKPERSKLTYEELRMRNRAQYTSMPNPGNSQYGQPMQSVDNNQPNIYNRPGSF